VRGEETNDCVKACVCSRGQRLISSVCVTMRLPISTERAAGGEAPSACLQQSKCLFFSLRPALSRQVAPEGSPTPQVCSKKY